MRKLFRNFNLTEKIISTFVLVFAIIFFYGIYESFVLRTVQEKKEDIYWLNQSSSLLLTAKYHLQSDLLTLSEILGASYQSDMEDWWLQHVFQLDYVQKTTDSLSLIISSIESNNLEEQLQEITNANQQLIEEYTEVVNPSFEIAYNLKLDALMFEGDDLVKQFEMERQILDVKEHIISVENAQMRRLSELHAKLQLHARQMNKDSSDLIIAKRRQTTLFTVGVIIGLIIIILFLLNSITSRIRILKDNIDRIAVGEVDSVVFDPNNDEVGEIAASVNRLSSGLKHITKAFLEIKAGNYNLEFQPTGANDKLGTALVEMQKSLQATKDEEERRKMEEQHRNWVTSGITDFNDVFRKNDNDFAKVSRIVVKKLVNYLNANQGGLFVNKEIEKEEPFLELIAAFAYDREKFLDKIVHKGEGLLGMVMLEKDTIHITEIPEDYIEIESGLGKTKPKAILIVPLLIDMNLYGVFELASLSDFMPHEIEFVEKIAESLASMIATQTINQQTSLLLEKSQKQAREMQLKEQELRENMEKMEKSQVEFQKREYELENVLENVSAAKKELDKKDEKTEAKLQRLKEENEMNLNALVEKEKQIVTLFGNTIEAIITFVPSGKILNANTVALELFGYAKSEIKEKDFLDLFSSKDVSLVSDFEAMVRKKQEVRIFTSKAKEYYATTKLAKSSISGKIRYYAFINNVQYIKEIEEKSKTLESRLLSKEFFYEPLIEKFEDLLKQNDIQLPSKTIDPPLIESKDWPHIGLQKIDVQHSRIKDGMNDLYWALKRESGFARVNELFRELVSLISFHFKFEEKYFEMFGYVQQKTHNAEHKEIMDYLNGLKAHVSETDVTLNYEKLKTLKELLLKHFVESDVKYVSTFQESGLE